MIDLRAGMRGVLKAVLNSIDPHGQDRAFFMNQWGADLSHVLLFEMGLSTYTKFGTLNSETLDPDKGIKPGYAGVIHVHHLLDKKGNPVNPDFKSPPEKGYQSYRKDPMGLYLIGYAHEGFSQIHGIVTAPESEEYLGASRSKKGVLDMVTLWRAANFPEGTDQSVDMGEMATLFMPPSGSRTGHATAHSRKQERNNRPSII